MKKILFFGVLLLLTACTEKYETAPDDANAYIVDSAVVRSSYIVFQLRDVEDDFVTPVTKCLDGIDYPRGTVVIIDDNAYVSKIREVSTEPLLLMATLVLLSLVVVYLVRKR